MACPRCGYVGAGWRWTPFAMGVLAGVTLSAIALVWLIWAV